MTNRINQTTTSAAHAVGHGQPANATAHAVSNSTIVSGNDNTTSHVVGINGGGNSGNTINIGTTDGPHRPSPTFGRPKWQLVVDQLTQGPLAALATLSTLLAAAGVVVQVRTSTTIGETNLNDLISPALLTIGAVGTATFGFLRSTAKKKLLRLAPISLVPAIAGVTRGGKRVPLVFRPTGDCHCGGKLSFQSLPTKWDVDADGKSHGRRRRPHAVCKRNDDHKWELDRADPDQLLTD